MIKKTFYEAPETELILVKFEEGFLTGTNGWDSPATSSTTWGDEGDDNGME